MSTTETDAPMLEYASPASRHADAWLTPQRASTLLLSFTLGLLAVDVFVLAAPQQWTIRRWVPFSSASIFNLFHYIPWIAAVLLAGSFVRLGAFRPAGLALRVARGIATAIIIVHALTPDRAFSHALFGYC